MYVSMKGMLQRANEGNYAVMAINCFNIETAGFKSSHHCEYRSGAYGESL